MVGSKSVTFENETEYIEFLKNDPRSGLLWMDHQGLQIVANAYQMNIHIFTVTVKGEGRWTHLVPDKRLEAFNKKEKNILVDDMWLIHQDEVHFDLIIHKDSVIANQEMEVETPEYQKCDNCDEKCKTER